MTVIAAAIDRDGTICMGADGMSTSRTSDARINNRSKVFQHGEFIIGSSGTLAVVQALEFTLEIPSVDQDEDLYSYMVTKLAPAVRKAMKDCGGEIKGQSGSDEMDGRILVGVRGKLFAIDSGYGVLESALLYHAIGCADQEALAAMFTAKRINPNFTAAEIVGYGLAAAEEFDLAIRGPFTILSTKINEGYGIPKLEVAA